MSRIFRWGRIKEENVEIHPQLNSSHQSTNIGACQSSSEAASPASTDFSLSLDDGIPSKLDEVRRDTGWVPRPKNAFMIFRCEYVREHTKEGKRVRRPPGTANPEKSLSKRAGEAWRQLSEEARNHFDKRAAQEKEEHSRLHPNYRYTPRRAVVQKEQARSKSQPPIPSPKTETPSDSIPFPQPSKEQESPMTLSPTQPPEPPVDIALVKAGRRRSSSVPLLPIGGILSYIPDEPFVPKAVAQPPKLETKRPVLGNQPPSTMTSPHEVPSFDPLMAQLDPSSGYYSSKCIQLKESLGNVQDAYTKLSSPFHQYSDSFATVDHVALEETFGTFQDVYRETTPTPTYQHPALDAPTTAVDGIAPEEYSLRTSRDIYQETPYQYPTPDPPTPVDHTALEKSFVTSQDPYEEASFAPYQHSTSCSITTAVDPDHVTYWNGEIHTPDSTTPWNSSCIADPHLLPGSLSGYNGTVSDVSMMVNYPYEDQWAPVPTEYSYLSPSPVELSLGLDASGMLFSPAALYHDIAAVPGESTEFVNPPATVETQTPEEAMFALNFDDYWHYAQ